MDERGFFQFLVDVALTADSFQELLRKIAENLKSPACFKDANGAIYIESDDHVFTEQVGAYPLEELRQRYFSEKIRDGERAPPVGGVRYIAAFSHGKAAP